MSLVLPGALRSVIDDQASGPRGVIFTVAERARAPIMGFKCGLPRYFVR